jgi:hypothetical protein
MAGYTELSMELLEMLKAKGYHSVIRVKEKDFTDEAASDQMYYVVLKPSMKDVIEDTKFKGELYSPILADDIKDMAKNESPFIDFLLEMDDEVYSNLKIK